jgi:polysaccharide biosynthesis protein PslH
MRILQICPRIPWPPLDGGRVAMAQLTESLRRVGAHVDVVALNQAKFRGQDVPADVEVVDIDTSDFLRAAMRMRKLRAPLLVARFYSPRFEQLLRERLRSGRYDAVQIEGQFLLTYVPAIREETRAPIVLRAQNVEFRIWEGLAAQASGPRRIALRQVARTLRTWEIAHLDDCDAVVPIAAEDEREFRALGATKPSLVLACGTPVSSPASPVDPHRLYFVGSMRYRPNQEAVRWLADEVWPRVMAIESRARLTVAGSGFPSPLREHLAVRGIEVAADIPDIRAFAAPFRAMLAPMFSGSGMRIKVLEAMALGKPVIATPLGAGGIDVTPGENILIADDAATFAQRVIDCMRDDALAQRLGIAAQRLIAERYDPDALARTLLAFYEGLSRNAS